MDSAYTIRVLSWNTQSIRLASEETPVTPKMFSLMKEYFDSDVVVIGFQEDRKPGSYFHSHVLPLEMPKLGYELVKRTRLMGGGITSYKSAIEGDFFVRGIRLSIYAKAALAHKIFVEEKELRTSLANDGQDEVICESYIWRNKGATISYLCLPHVGRIAIVCCHLPFKASSITEAKLEHEPMLRQTELNLCNKHFNHVIESAVLKRHPKPTHLLMFGDLNYRVAYASAKEAAELLANDESDAIPLLYQNDELQQQMNRGNIYKLSEGVDDSGPTFKPTCKLDSSRHYLCGKYDQRVPSWCDRILYGCFGIDGFTLKCESYDSYDGYEMVDSDHSGITARFTLER